MARYLSFRFDDGFFVGALKANLLLAPSRGSFFLVTGLMERTHQLTQPEFEGRDFGNPAAWRLLAEAGHDIQAHSVTHPSLPELSRDQQIVEIRDSLSSIRKIHDGPYVFCCPYNQRPNVDFSSLGFSAAGFLGSPNSLPYNQRSTFDPFLLRSKVVFQEDYDWIVRELRTSIPHDAWVILGFHSFDDEGYRPWKFAPFAELVRQVRSLDYQIETVSSMISKFSNQTSTTAR